VKWILLLFLALMVIPLVEAEVKINITSPINTSVNASQNIDLRWTATRNLTSCQLSFDGGTNTTYLCPFDRYSGFNFNTASTTRVGLTWNGSSFFTLESNSQNNGFVVEYNSSGSLTGFNFSVSTEGFPDAVLWNGTFFAVMSFNPFVTDNIFYLYSKIGESQGEVGRDTTWATSFPDLETNVSNYVHIAGSGGSENTLNVLRPDFTIDSTLTLSSNVDLRGIAYVNPFWYVADNNDDMIYEYDRSWTNTNSFYFGSEDSTPKDMTSNGTHLLMVGGDNNKVFSYRLNTSQLNSTFLNLSEGKHNITLWGNESFTSNNFSFHEFIANNQSPQWNGNVTNATSLPSIGNQINFKLNVSDNYNLSKIIFSWNMTGVWTNESEWVNMGTYFPIDLNLTINNTRNNHDIGWKVFINDTLNNKNETPTFLIKIINSNVSANVTTNYTSALSVQDILAFNQTFDADNDSISTNWGVFINQTFFDFRTPFLFKHNVTSGANITFQANVSDGYNNFFFNSSKITVGDNVAPTVTSGLFDLGTYTQNQNANISVNCTDANSVQNVYAYLFSNFDNGGTINRNLTLTSSGINTYSASLQMSGVGIYSINETWCVDGSGNIGHNGNVSLVNVDAVANSGSSGGGGGGSPACFNPVSCSIDSDCCFGFTCTETVCKLTSQILQEIPKCGDNKCDYNPPTYTEDALFCPQDCSGGNPIDAVFCSSGDSNCIWSSFNISARATMIIFVGVFLFLAFVSPNLTKKKRRV